MKNLNYLKSEPVNVPVNSRIDTPGADIVILESLYRRIGLDAATATRAAWSDYALFRNGPPPEGRSTT